MKSTLAIFLFCLVSITSKSQFLQNSLLSSGGDMFKNSTAQIEWIVGELTVETYKNDVYLTQGFLQGSPIRLVGQQELTTISTSQLLVYPNPFVNKFQIRFDNLVSDEVSVTVFNQLGQQVKYVTIAVTDEVIDLTNHATGIYLVVVYNGNSIIETIKLHKL